MEDLVGFVTFTLNLVQLQWFYQKCFYEMQCRASQRGKQLKGEEEVQYRRGNSSWGPVREDGEKEMQCMC